MTAPIAGTGTPAPTERTKDPLGGAILGKDDFLRLLVTQLRNQDPLNPMEGTEFATQLAQFSSVEQLITLGDKLDTMAEAAQASQQLGETALGASLVGKEALLNGDTLTVLEGQAPTATVDLPEGVAATRLVVYGKDGKIVAQQDYGSLGAGRRTLSLTDAELPPGDYRYEVIAKDGQARTLTVRTFTTARIDGMSMRDGEVLLRVGGQLLPAASIIEIRAPAPAAAPRATPPAGDTTP